MKMNWKITTNLKTKEALKELHKRAENAALRVIVLIANDAIKESPVLTGNNRRSIFYGVTGAGHKQASGEGRRSGDTWAGADNSLTNTIEVGGVVYSTSGYGGYLEIDTKPYLKPALDKHFDKFGKFMQGGL